MLEYYFAQKEPVSDFRRVARSAHGTDHLPDFVKGEPSSEYSEAGARSCMDILFPDFHMFERFFTSLSIKPQHPVNKYQRIMLVQPMEYQDYINIGSGFRAYDGSIEDVLKYLRPRIRTARDNDQLHLLLAHWSLQEQVEAMLDSLK